MPHNNNHKPGTPKQWLDRAKSNLVRAQAKQTDVYLEDLCFDAQQAAEKAVKAILIHYEIEFRYVHDLEELITTLEKHNKSVPECVKEAIELTQYAVEFRYPGVYEPVTEEEYNKAVAISKSVITWAEKIVNS